MLSVLVCFSSNLSSSGPVSDFRKLCLFCAKPCSIIPDERHPDRWEKNAGILCKTADRKVQGQKVLSFKEVLLQVNLLKSSTAILKVIDAPNHQLIVPPTPQGAPSDLYAADARQVNTTISDCPPWLVSPIKQAQFVWFNLLFYADCYDV